MRRRITRSEIVTVVALAAVLFLPCTGLGRLEARAIRGSELSQQRDPPIFVDYRNPPQTWGEALDRADLVAVIKLRALSYPQGNEKDMPKTRFQADVLEVIGGPRASSVGTEIAVTRYGGIKQIGGVSKKIDQAGFPAWDVGRTCVVFLGWSDLDQSYHLRFGPDSAFELDPSTNKVRTFGHGKLAGLKRGKPFTEVLTEIKNAKR